MCLTGMGVSPAMDFRGCLVDRLNALSKSRSDSPRPLETAVERDDAPVESIASIIA
jgi:hypothetical protein